MKRSKFKVPNIVHFAYFGCLKAGIDSYQVCVTFFSNTSVYELLKTGSFRFIINQVMMSQRMVNQDNERKYGTLVKFNFTKRKLEQLTR